VIPRARRRAADAALHLGTTARDRVDALEDHMNATAVMRGDLEEARLYAHGALHDLGREWEEIVGWETHLRRRSRDATQAEISATKAEIRPDLSHGLRDAKWLVTRLGEQIDRLSHMATTTSPPASTPDYGRLGAWNTRLARGVPSVSTVT
jgi:hypothetical protein